MAELVDALDSKSCESNLVRVQVPPRPPKVLNVFVNDKIWLMLVALATLRSCLQKAKTLAFRARGTND